MTRLWELFDAFMCRKFLGYRPLEWFFAIGLVGSSSAAWVLWVFYI